MKERNDQLLFLSGMFIGAIGLVVLFFNHEPVLLGLEGLLLNKLGRSLFAWVKRYNNDRSGPMMLNDPIQKLFCVLLSAGMTWGGVIMMWFANQMATYAYIAYLFIRGSIEGIKNSDSAAVNQIVASYKQIKAICPDDSEEKVLSLTAGAVMKSWKEPDYRIESICENHDWKNIHEVVDYLLIVRSRVVGNGYPSHDFNDIMARHQERESLKNQVDVLLSR